MERTICRRAQSVTVTRTRVASLSQFPSGTMRRVELAGRDLVIANVGGVIYAFDNRCPHAGAPLSSGALMGDCVMCLSHGWTFDLATSKSARPKTDLALKSYTVIVVSDDIYLELS